MDRFVVLGAVLLLVGVLGGGIAYLTPRSEASVGVAVLRSLLVSGVVVIVATAALAALLSWLTTGA